MTDDSKHGQLRHMCSIRISLWTHIAGSRID